MTMPARARVEDYNANGTTNPYTVPFRFFADTELLVSLIADGIQTDLVLGTHYTVTGGDGSTGTIVPTADGAALAVAPKILRIKGATTIDQQADYLTNDNFPAETHERALDRLTAIAGEARADVDDITTRALRLPPGEAAEVLSPAADRAGKFLTGAPGGGFIWVEGTGEDDDLRSDLADPDLGDNLTATQANLAAGAVTRASRDKLGDILDLRDTGAVGLNGVADAGYIATLFANAMPGQRIHGLRGAAAAAQFKRAGAAFSLTRAIDFDFEHGVDLRVDQTTGQRFAGLSINVNFTDGDVATTTNGEYRGGWLRGGRVFTYNTTTSAADNLAGGFGIDVGAGSAKATIGLTLEKMRIGGGYGAVRFTSVGGNELQWCQIVRSSLTNGVLFDAEDGEIAVDCISGGLNPGFTFSLTYGAFNCGVFRGTIANTDGAIDVQDGSFIKIHDVQIEHAAYLADGVTASADSSLTFGAHIVLRGLNYPCQGSELIGLNLGAGTKITNSVSIANARHTKVYRCQWNVAGPAGTSADLLLARDAGDAAKDAYDVILGYDQVFRGARALRAVGDMTDVTRRMVISLSSGSLRQPHRGILFGLFALLTGKAVGLTDVGLEAMIEHSGTIAITGKMTRAGFFGDTLEVCTFPSWMLPFADAEFPVYGAGGAQALGVLNKTTGKLVIEGTGLAASTKIVFPLHPWRALVNPAYAAPA